MRCAVSRALLGLVFPLILVGTATFGAEERPPCIAALLVIDVQNVWSHSEDDTTVDGTHILEKLPEVLELARSTGVLVVYIKDVSQRETRSEEDLEFPDEIVPLEDEWIVEKTMQDGFAFTELDERLKEAGVTRVLISGLVSQGCVNATLGGAKRRGYEVVVLADAHTDGIRGILSAEHNTRWAARGSTVVPTADLDWTTVCEPADPPDD